MADDQRSFLSKLFGYNPPVVQQPQQTQIAEPREVEVIHVDGIGSSGTETYAGYISEDYLQELRGTDAANIYDKMRRSDSTVRMNLSAVKNPIKSAKWSVRPGDETPEAEKLAEQIEWTLFKGMNKSWNGTLHEILSLVDFGWSGFEVQHKIIEDHPEFGTFVGLQQLGYRSQRTIDKWVSDPNTGELLYVEQIANGDFGRMVSIPSEFLLLFTLDEEGNNYEGVSMLRSVYGAWKRKQAYLKLMAIGVEKYAVPTPVLDIPPEKFESAQFAKAVEVLRKYISGQNQYITKPAGWEITFPESKFDPAKLKEAIDFENKEITRGFLANFLELGSTGGGSYALSFDQSDFFLGQLEHIACQICETINNKLIPNLVKLNHGEQYYYPKLSCSGITDRPGKELAETLDILTRSKVIVPDNDLEIDIRERYNLPEKSEDGQREMTPPPNPLDPNGQQEEKLPPKKEDVVKEEVKAAEPLKLSEASGKKAVKLIDGGREAMYQLMTNKLDEIMSTQIKKVLQKSQRLSKSQRLTAIKDLTFAGKSEYKDMLKNFMSKLSLDSLNQVRAEIPGNRNAKLMEQLDSFSLSEFDKLPPKLKKQILFLSNQLVGTQLADMEKELAFRFESASEIDGLAERAAELNKAKDKYIGGTSIQAAAGASSANIVNSARNAFFMSDDVVDQIESFTFENPDPVTQICQELTGQTFSVDDPNFRRFEPPLHWNCKSVYVPNLKGTKAADKELEKNGLGPKNKSALASITFAEAGDMSIHQIIISKKLARTRAEAMDLIMQYKGGLVNTLEETESDYRVVVGDLSLMVTGSLKSFEPMEGIHLVYGNLKNND